MTDERRERLEHALREAGPFGCLGAAFLMISAGMFGAWVLIEFGKFLWQHL
jgi:hypothetical protein